VEQDKIKNGGGGGNGGALQPSYHILIQAAESFEQITPYNTSTHAHSGAMRLVGAP